RVPRRLPHVGEPAGPTTACARGIASRGGANVARICRRIPMTTRPAWKILEEHHRTTRTVHLRDLFAGDPKRGERLTLEAAGVYLDYSKNRVSDETLRLLVGLAEESGL